MKQRILITGGSGLLGGNLTKIMSSFFEVHTTYYSNSFEMDGIETHYLDIKNREEVFNIIRKIQPKIIIHTAAMTQISFCEKLPELTYEVNVMGTQNICDAAKEINSKIIYISTDHVFNGKLGYYAEYDIPNPITVYGKTKLLGEQVVQDSKLKYNIIRTFFYGLDLVNRSKYNFIVKILSNLENGRQIKGYKDIFFTPVFVNNLIEGIIELCYRNIDGIFNLAGSERISHFGFLKKVAEVFKLNPELIIEDRASNYNWSKLRGPDLSLGIHKSLVNLKSKLLDIESGLEFMKKTYNKNLLDKKNPLIYI